MYKGVCILVFHSKGIDFKRVSISFHIAFLDAKCDASNLISEKRMCIQFDAHLIIMKTLL